MVALGWFFITLSGASAAFGLFVYRTLSSYGFAAGYDAALSLTVAAAAAFAASQLAYVTLIAFLKPVRGAAFWVTESFSQIATLVFLPYLADWKVSWPHPALEKVEPLIYLAVFALAHGFFKLLSFFAALQSEPGKRLWGVLWATGLIAAGMVSAQSATTWLDLLEQSRPKASSEEKVYRIGNEYARAKSMPENTTLSFDWEPYPNRCLTVRWAKPNNDPHFAELSRIYVYAVLYGKHKKTVSAVVRLRDTGWAEFVVPADEITEDVHTCTIRWRAEKEPFWQSLLGVYPIDRGNSLMLMSGPWSHGAPPTDGSHPNLIIIGVDGLGVQNMSRFTNRPDTTRSLDQFSQTALTFTYAFSPAPEPAAAYMSLLTGLYPLEHGFLGKHTGPLPQKFKTLPELLAENHYATAAFTEGEPNNDLVYGNGWERGFEIFDPTYSSVEKPSTTSETNNHAADGENSVPETDPSSPVIGSRATLERAKAWIDRHANTRRFAVFIRLQEAAELKWRDCYGSAAATSPRPSQPQEVYEAALSYLDRQLGAFLKELRDSALRQNTVIVLTSPRGMNFDTTSLARPFNALSEQTLRIPVILYGAQIPRGTREDLIALTDVTTALASVTGCNLKLLRTSSNFLAGPINSLPISMAGEPLVLTLRSPKWRMFWQSGRIPFSSHQITDPRPPELYDVKRTMRYGFTYDEAAKNPDLVSRWRSILEELLRTHDMLWDTAAQK
ncbi:MAG TPA: sulfatase-like hydrolase/transferase [Candidatus Hydrogenedentes bacterium]|nr:sulfatase-like hydrolase/transferase [Candidatus Hydrogenedentota bacterium]HOL78360.1 sulfatase-like hydrolase/transferase [Candidatus Hydrogenedentota bacterium]HPO87576.1 sulfatase-like hydrolase/transferase [Candidatus Hydrogenedentota bacterium]